MNIVCCTDHNYIMPTGVMICSTCVNHQDCTITFHVVCNDDVTEEDKQDLKDIVHKYHHKIEYYAIDIEFPECFMVGKEGQPIHITIASYYRLFLAELLPNNIDKVIYLDGDIIVRHSLLEIYNTNLENKAVAVVTDMDEGSIKKYNYLRYKQSLGYFNAGVLLINLKYWREYNLLNEFIDFATKYPECIKFHDQDVLNFVLKENKIKLPLKYNVQDGFFRKIQNISWEYEDDLKEAINNPVIVHFTCGNNKPWNKGCNVPYKEEFFKYRNLTKWKNEPLKRTTYSNKTRIKQHIKKVLILLGVMRKPESKYISINK